MDELPLVDNHSHLQHEKFDGIRDDVIKECEKRMRYVVVSGANDIWNKKAVELFSNKERFLITLGIHPVDSIKLSEKEFEEALEFIKQSSKKLKNLIGIGEIGLDYHWVKEKEKIEKMKERFIMQISLADELRLPVITHSWDAEEDVIRIVSNHKKDNRVVMHCYGSPKHCEIIHEHGFLAAICTNITRSKNVKKVVKRLNLENMLTETDAPYLSPIPNEINYPWNVKLTLEKIAEIKKISIEEVANTIYKNFVEFYGLR